MSKLSRGALPLTKVLAVGGILAVIATSAPLIVAPASARSTAVSPIDGEIADFYRSRGGAPLWFARGAGNAASQLLQLLASSQADHLNPRRYDLRALERAVADARTGNPAAIQRAEAMLSAAFVTYADDMKHDPGVGIIYVDKELRPTPPSAGELLNAAAHASSLGDYVSQMRWMNPIYAKLRQAIASRLYANAAQYQLLSLNLERARALPSGNGRFVIVNPPAARLYMYENGQVVDSMRVVAGRTDPVAQTPMMNAYIRYIALNPYWNSPPDITARKLAPTILKEGRAYFTRGATTWSISSARMRTSSTRCRSTGMRSLRDA